MSISKFESFYTSAVHEIAHANHEQYGDYPYLLELLIESVAQDVGEYVPLAYINYQAICESLFMRDELPDKSRVLELAYELTA